MAKYSGKTATTLKKTPQAPISTTAQPLRTFNGDLAFARDAKSDLFVLAVTFMGEQESTYYESGDARQKRFVDLIHTVTQSDPVWMQGFIPFLRNEAFMRTASIVAAAEYVAIRGEHGATVVDSACKRADEPAELLGYWLAKYGRQLPMALKRGLARASVRLYTEFNALKYDGVSHGVRMGDVIELAHPAPVGQAQSALFEYLLDRRHHPDEIRALTGTGLGYLQMVAHNRALRAMPVELRRDLLRNEGADLLSAAGMTWESLSEWLPGDMDAEAWEWIIPSLGYMALLRNLRNFDEAGVSETVADSIIERLSDPAQVAKSMQFPYRFLSAYKNTNSTRWARSLDRALDYSCSNIPKLNGRSLVLVDISGSMAAGISNRSTMSRAEAAAVFGVAQFRAADFEGDLVAFATGNVTIPLRRGTSVLKGTEALTSKLGSIGYGTEMWPALAQHYNQHDRVFIFTDEQANRSYGRSSILSNVKAPIYFFNLGGYAPAVTEMGKDGRYEFGGLSDATFRQIALLEASKDAWWPWEKESGRVA